MTIKGDIGNESARRETKYGGGRMEMKKRWWNSTYV